MDVGLSRAGTPLWRELFDAVERPLAAGAETWVQSETFMDALALSWKAQRATVHTVQRATALWLGLAGVPTRADVKEVANQIARLERQVRLLAEEIEAQEKRGAMEALP